MVGKKDDRLASNSSAANALHALEGSRLRTWKSIRSRIEHSASTSGSEMRDKEASDRSKCTHRVRAARCDIRMLVHLERALVPRPSSCVCLHNLVGDVGMDQLGAESKRDRLWAFGLSWPMLRPFLVRRSPPRSCGCGWNINVAWSARYLVEAHALFVFCVVVRSRPPKRCRTTTIINFHIWKLPCTSTISYAPSSLLVSAIILSDR